MLQWILNQREAEDLIRSLGSAEQQRQILGADYAWVVATIDGTGAPPAATLPSRLARVPKRPLNDAGG